MMEINRVLVSVSGGEVDAKTIELACKIARRVSNSGG